MSFTRITGPGISSYPVITGIITALNFKTGTTNVHSVGVEAAGINVLGGDTPIGTGATIYKDGGARFSGIVTATTINATSFSGDGSNLTSLPAGLGTALSSTQTSPLNKLYYTDNVLSVGATITVDPPSSASAAYTQYTDIVVEDTADLIMGDGDDLVPDVLGLSTETAISYSAVGGRIRAGTFTNAGANGAPTATNGWIVTGVNTATTFKGALTGNVTGNISGGTVAGSTGTFSSNVIISGNLGVAGTITYEDVARVDATGISTFREGYQVGPLAGIALTAYKDGSIRTSGIVTAASFVGDGSGLTGAGPSLANGVNNRIITATGANALTGEAYLTFNGTGDLTVTGDENTAANLILVSDQSDNTADEWRLSSQVDNLFSIANDDSGSFVNKLEIHKAGNVTINDGSLVMGTSGRLLVGATSANVIHNNNANAAGDSTTPLLYAEGTGDSKSLTIVSNNTNAWRGSVLGLARTRGTSVGDNTIIAANDNVGQIVFAAADGTDIRSNCASIRADIDGTPGANDVPGRLVFATTADGAVNPTERFKIDKDGKFYKEGNQFYPLVNYEEVANFGQATVSSNSYTDMRTIKSSYSPKKAGNLIVIHHQAQLWQGTNASSNGDAMWRIQKNEGGGGWGTVIANERIIGNMDGRNYTGGSGLARHHRTVHLMGSFTCNGSSFDLKSQGKVDFTDVGLQWYHNSENILQIWEYGKG